jgi:hypothetical protein
MPHTLPGKRAHRCSSDEAQGGPSFQTVSVRVSTGSPCRRKLRLSGYVSAFALNARRVRCLPAPEETSPRTPRMRTRHFRQSEMPSAALHTLRRGSLLAYDRTRYETLLELALQPPQSGQPRPVCAGWLPLVELLSGALRSVHCAPEHVNARKCKLWQLVGAALSPCPCLRAVPAAG